jgi:hypothetical protein
MCILKVSVFMNETISFKDIFLEKGLCDEEIEVRYFVRVFFSYFLLK